MRRSVCPAVLSRQAFAVRFRLAVIVAAAALLVPASASASGVTVSDLDNGAAGNLSAPSDTASATPQASSVVCDKVISPGQSVSAVVNSLAPGQTGCLHGGTYTEGT